MAGDATPCREGGAASRACARRRAGRRTGRSGSRRGRAGSSRRRVHRGRRDSSVTRPTNGQRLVRQAGAERVELRRGRGIVGHDGHASSRAPRTCRARARSAGPVVPAQQQRRLGCDRGRDADDDAPRRRSRGGSPSRTRIASSSAAMRISRSSGPSTVAAGRVEVHAAGGAGDPDERRVLERVLGLAERRARERRLVAEVDLVAVEVEQLAVDDRQAGLAAGLRDDPRHDVADDDQLDLVLARRACAASRLLRVVDLGDDVVRLGPAVRVVGDREDRLDDLDVGLVDLRREDDDRARPLDAGDVDLVEVDRAARSGTRSSCPACRRCGSRISSSISTLSRSARTTTLRAALVGVRVDELRRGS